MYVTQTILTISHSNASSKDLERICYSLLVFWATKSRKDDFRVF